MNRLTCLSLALAFAFAGSTATRAAATNVTIGFDGLCDTMAFTLNKPVRAWGVLHLAGCAARHLPSSNPIPGVGIVVKRPPGSSTARYMLVGETVPDGGGTPVGYTFVIDYPFVTGGGWLVYSTSDGAAVKEIAAGTYTVQ
jgi:hypothetical protein